MCVSSGVAYIKIYEWNAVAFPSRLLTFPNKWHNKYLRCRESIRRVPGIKSYSPRSNQLYSESKMNVWDVAKSKIKFSYIKSRSAFGTAIAVAIDIRVEKRKKKKERGREGQREGRGARGCGRTPKAWWGLFVFLIKGTRFLKDTYAGNLNHSPFLNRQFSA